MPRSVAQWTGLAVTVIIALGCDQDVFYAVPIGLLAGALAAALVALDDWRAAGNGKLMLAQRPSGVARD